MFPALDNHARAPKENTVCPVSEWALLGKSDISLQHADLELDDIENTLAALTDRLRTTAVPAGPSGENAAAEAAESEPAELRDRVREAIEGKEPVDSVAANAPNPQQQKDSPEGTRICPPNLARTAL